LSKNITISLTCGYSLCECFSICCKSLYLVYCCINYARFPNNCYQSSFISDLSVKKSQGRHMFEESWGLRYPKSRVSVVRFGGIGNMWTSDSKHTGIQIWLTKESTKVRFKAQSLNFSKPNWKPLCRSQILVVVFWLRRYWQIYSLKQNS